MGGTSVNPAPNPGPDRLAGQRGELGYNFAAKPMYLRVAVIGVLLALTSLVAAQAKKKIYLDPDSTFSPCFSAALQKKKVPVTVTMDPKQADCTALFQAKNKNGSIVEGCRTWDRATTTLIPTTNWS